MVLEIVHHHLLVTLLTYLPSITCLSDERNDSAHLCAAAKVDSYVLQDLTRPESARTRKILSGFHNFMLHRHERLPVTDKYLTDFDNAVEKELQLDYEIEEKKRRIKELK